MKVLTIGRSSDNDIVINDSQVSRHHLQLIKHDDGHFTLSDFGSTNGTYVNGRKIGGEIPLSNSDIIRIGGTTLPWQSYFVQKQFQSTQLGLETASPNVNQRQSNTWLFAIIGLVAVFVVVAILFMNKSGDGVESSSGTTYTTPSGGQSHSNVPGVRDSRPSNNAINSSTTTKTNASSNPNKTFNFAGHWVWEKGDGFFELILVQNNGKVTGTYSSIFGNKMDVDEGNYVKGDVKENIVQSKFYSAGWGGRGTADITYISDDKIRWKIRNTEDVSLAPDEVVLTKRK